MKCHLCVNYIEMQTDPATCDYVIVSGASRKEERWNMTENEQILTTGTHTQYNVSNPAVAITPCYFTLLFCSSLRAHGEGKARD